MKIIEKLQIEAKVGNLNKETIKKCMKGCNDELIHNAVFRCSVILTLGRSQLTLFIYLLDLPHPKLMDTTSLLQKYLYLCNLYKYTLLKVSVRSIIHLSEFTIIILVLNLSYVGICHIILIGLNIY